MHSLFCAELRVSCQYLPGSLSFFLLFFRSSLSLIIDIEDWASTGNGCQFCIVVSGTKGKWLFPVPVCASELGLARQVRSSHPALARPFSTPRLNLVLTLTHGSSRSPRRCPSIYTVNRHHRRHSSYNIHHTSYIIYHTSYHTSYIIHHISYINNHTSYIINHTSYIIHHISYIIHHRGSVPSLSGHAIA